MTKRDIPHLTPARQAERAARDKRLAAALRDNLRRRKEQARAKAEAPADEANPSPTPASPAVEAEKKPQG